MSKSFMNMATAVAIMALSASSIFAQESSQDVKNYAVVEFSANMMREEPDYAAELGDQALMGTIVELLDTNSYWVKIKSPEPYTAWVNAMGLVPMDGIELQNYLDAPKYICTAEASHVYEEPDKDSRIVSELILGDIVRIMYKIKTHTSGSLKGYDEGHAVLTKKFVGVVLPSGKTGYVPSSDVDLFYRWANERLEESGKPDKYRKSIIATAMKFLGVPYMWGGTSIKNVDCSGLSRSVYFANGVLLPRNCSQQVNCGEDIGIFDVDGSVNCAYLLPGDLIFWGRPATETTKEKATHVGIYIGDGRFIHSSQVVRINSLDPTQSDYYQRKPIRVRRVIGHVDKKGSGVVSVRRSPYYFYQE